MARMNSVVIRPADHADTRALMNSVMMAQGHLHEACGSMPIEEVVADRGYHAAATPELVDAYALRTLIPEPKRQHRRAWSGKPAGHRRCAEKNRRGVRRRKGKRLQRLRGERSRTSATARARVGAGFEAGRREQASRDGSGHNPGRILHSLTRVGKPRALRRMEAASALALGLIEGVWESLGLRVGPPRPPAGMRPLAA